MRLLEGLFGYGDRRHRRCLLGNNSWEEREVAVVRSWSGDEIKIVKAYGMESEQEFYL